MSVSKVLAMLAAVLMAASTVPLSLWMLWRPLSDQILQENTAEVSQYPCHDDGEIYLIHLRDVVSDQMRTAN